MSYNFSKVNVLVVESTKEMYDLFKSVLYMLSVPERNIYSAYSAEEGFNEFCKKRHDIIITDWLQNPDRGIHLTEMIRKHQYSPNVYAPIIMSAGSAHYNRVIKARDSGISEYLVKPFTAEALALRITRVIERPRPFVLAENFTGPDRRVKQCPIDFADRREEDPIVEME